MGTQRPCVGGWHAAVQWTATGTMGYLPLSTARPHVQPMRSRLAFGPAASKTPTRWWMQRVAKARHRDTETPRNRDTETPRHRGTETPRLHHPHRRKEAPVATQLSSGARRRRKAGV